MKSIRISVEECWEVLPNRIKEKEKEKNVQKRRKKRKEEGRRGGRKEKEREEVPKMYSQFIKEKGHVLTCVSL